MKNWMRKLFPTKKPMSPEELRRAKAMLLGAGCPARPDSDGTIRVHTKGGVDMTKDITDESREYGGLISDAVRACHSRRSLQEGPLSPCSLQGDKPHPHDAIKLEKLNAQIGQACRDMRKFERKHGYGIGVVLGDIPDSVRLATAILMAGACTASVRLQTVGELAQLASADDPVQLLEVLLACDLKGRMRPHIKVDVRGAANVSKFKSPALVEDSLRCILHMPPNDEFSTGQAE